jgi:hypothetical protein
MYNLLYVYIIYFINNMLTELILHKTLVLVYNTIQSSTCRWLYKRSRNMMLLKDYLIIYFNCNYLISCFRLRNCMYILLNINTMGCLTWKVLHILSVCLWPCLSSMPSACTTLSPMTCRAVPYFPTLSHNTHGFRGKQLFNTEWMFQNSLQNFSWNIYHSTDSSAKYH